MSQFVLLLSAAGALIVGAGFAAESSAAPSAPVAPPPLEWRIAFVAPASGPLTTCAAESLEGLKAALEVFAKETGQPKPTVIELDDGDDAKKADAAFESAKKQKADVVIAAATGVTAELYVAKARKEKLPLLLIGSCGPTSFTIAPDEPVFWLGPWPVERAITIGTFLELPCRSKKPGVVAEETPRGKELAAALERNLGWRMERAGTLFVPPHVASDAAPLLEGLKKLQADGADRLVVIGEPDLADATIAALSTLKWKVPLFLDDAALSGATKSLWGSGVDARLEGTFVLTGSPRFLTDVPSELATIWGRAHAGVKPDLDHLPFRTLRAFATTRLFFTAVAPFTKKPKLAEIVGALGEQAYGTEENGRPLLDETHRSARQRWLPWKLGAEGPIRDEPTFWFDPEMGPLLRVRKPKLYDKVEPNTKVVWFSFGDATSKAVRSIEEDLFALGLITKGYDGEFDGWVLDELMSRALGKLNKLFLKNEDGTFIPGVSFAISFTTQKPTDLKESDYWRAVIAGDDPEAGGRAWPGEGRCEIYSTFMRRTIYLDKAIHPPVRGEDRQYLDGKYVWGTKSADNLRVKLIRALIDGYAGSFALTGAHELGHVAGLGHDEQSPRSIMNVAEGAGLAETSACWIPDHVAILEKSLGRFAPNAKPAKKKR